MPIFKNSSVYQQTLRTMVALLGIAGGSAGLFVWLNQQGLDHSWQQAHHEPAPWSGFTGALWRVGGRIEAGARSQVSLMETALEPYQDIMSASTVDDDHDEGGDDGLDMGESRAPSANVTSPTAPPSSPPMLLPRTAPVNKHDDARKKLPDLAKEESSSASLEKTVKAADDHQSHQVQQTPLPPPRAMVPTPQLHSQASDAMSSRDTRDTKAEQPAPPRPQENAQNHILFIGDSMMQGVAPHVVTALRRHYHLQSYDLSLQSTGLAYPNFFNWPETLRTTLAQKPGITTVVVFLGPNDPWDMPSTARHGHYLKFGSPAWEEDYRGRIRAILHAAQEHHARVIWIGPPATKRVRLSEGIGYLDHLFQSETEKAGQTYLSVDRLFHYRGHQYSETMERDGREVRLRSGDGTHFSVTGQKIIAAAVMKELRPSLEKGASP